MSKPLTSAGYRTVIPRRYAFTLIEILVVVAIIALLISILLPSLARAREQTRRVLCATRLHNIGVANQLYSQTNRGKIIQCMVSGNPDDPATGSAPPDWTQVCIAPRRLALNVGLAPGKEYMTYQYMDWWQLGKKFRLDREMWECPNRPGSFTYEGQGGTTQGYTAADLKSSKYSVNSTLSYEQWVIGYQYLGGMTTWDLTWVPTVGKRLYNVNSPNNFNRARPQWTLACESNIRGDTGWGTGRPSLYSNCPPHPDADGGPAGGNVLYCDSSVSWVPRTRWVPFNYWHSDGATQRKVYFYQADLGEYAKGPGGPPQRGMPK